MSDAKQWPQPEETEHCIRLAVSGASSIYLKVKAVTYVAAHKSVTGVLQRPVDSYG